MCDNFAKAFRLTLIKVVLQKETKNQAYAIYQIQPRGESKFSCQKRDDWYIGQSKTVHPAIYPHLIGRGALGSVLFEKWEETRNRVKASSLNREEYNAIKCYIEINESAREDCSGVITGFD